MLNEDRNHLGAAGTEKQEQLGWAEERVFQVLESGLWSFWDRNVDSSAPTLTNWRVLFGGVLRVG